MTKKDRIISQIQWLNIERSLYDIQGRFIIDRPYSELESDLPRISAWERLVSIEPNLTMFPIITRQLTNPIR